MYRKLLPMLNQFILVRQGMLNRSYIGRLLDVDQETMEIQTYHSDGTEAECWTLCMSTITEFLTQSQQLNTLALKVKWLNSHDSETNEGIAPTSNIQTS